MLKDKNQNLFREERLVWMSPPEGGPAAEPTPAADAVKAVEAKEQIEYKEKLTPDKIDEIADRVKNLTLAAPVDIDSGKIATAPKLKVAINKMLQGLEPKLEVKNLDQFLLNGLLEQLGKADKKISKMDWRENNDLSKFLKEHKVTKFTIEDGYWKFFDKDGKPVQADYQLDGVGNAPTETAVLGSAVQKAKEADAAAQKEAEAQAKTEAERTDTKKLEQVKSALSVPLGSSMSIDDLLKPLEQTVRGADGKPAINAQEMREALTSYLANAGEADPEKNFAAFMKVVLSQGYTECRIEAGRFVFTKNNTRPSSNPLNVSDGAVQDIMYAHPKLATARKAEAKQEAKEKADDAEQIKTSFDDAEQEAIKIITGKENPEENDVNNANIDARYLPAIKGILAYREGGVPMDVKIPFNDQNPMDCKFYVAKDGAYILSWSGGKGFYRFTPSVKGSAGLKEAQRFFVASLTNGRIFQEVQRKNVNDKTSFEQWGMEVDKGPTPVENGGVYYEFDWKGRDPDVFVYTEPHGALRVIVKKSGIALDGGDVYQFRSGGFQDMIRTLKRLQSWAEGDEQVKNNLRNGERDARFFEDLNKGAVAFRAEAKQRGAGKLLNIVSVRNFEPNGKVATDPLARGYMFDFDWMQKLVPPRRLQMFRNGVGNFEYYLMPTKQKLGEIGPGVSAADAMNQALVLVAEQKTALTTKGGEKMRTKVFQDTLEAVNQSKLAKVSPYELVKTVQVEAASATGVVYLSMLGMQPVAFRFGNEKQPNIAEFNRAVEQGYLIRRPEGLAVEVVEGRTDKVPTQSDKPVSARLEVATEEGERPASFKERIPHMQQKVDAIHKVLKAPEHSLEKFPSYTRVQTYLAYRFASFEPQEKSDQVKMAAELEEEIWKLLAEMTGSTYQTDTSGKLSPEWKKGIIDKLKGPRVPRALDANPRYQVSELSTQLKEMPKTNMVLRGYLDSFDDLKKSTSLSAEVFAKVQAQYKQELISLVQDLVKGGKQKGEKQMDYDARVFNMLQHRLRLPHEYLDAVKDQLADAEEKQKTQKEQSTLRAEYEARLNGDVNQMSLDELVNGRKAGMVAKAVTLFQTVKSLKREEVFFSRMEGNDTFAQDEACFNVKAKNGDGYLPMTVHVFKEAGKIWVSASDGLSNVSRGDRSVMVGAGPEAIDVALARAVARHNGQTPDVMNKPAVPDKSSTEKPAEAPGGVPAEKATTPPAPASK